MSHFDNYLVDNQSCVIVGVQATAARLSQESAAARDMLTRIAQRHGSMPMSLAADAGYGNGELLNWLEERNITPYMHTREGQARQNSKLHGIDQFTYVPETGNYICPEGKQLNYLGIHTKNRNHVWFSTPARCRDCSQKSQCTTGNHRRLSIHIHEVARQRACDRANTPAFKHALSQRRKVEALFGELKKQIGLRRLRLRRIKYVREQFFLAATAQNIKHSSASSVRNLNRRLRFLPRNKPPRTTQMIIASQTPLHPLSTAPFSTATSFITHYLVASPYQVSGAFVQKGDYSAKCSAFHARWAHRLLAN